MSNLLFLVHRLPFPPDKGDKIRSFNLLRHLSTRYQIFLGGFVDKNEDWQYLAELEKYCSEVFFRPVSRLHSGLSVAQSLIRGRSLSVGYYSDKALRLWVEELLRTIQFDVVVSFSSTMAQFLPQVVPRKSIVHADFVDLDSDKWRQYASEAKWPMSLVYAYEAKALAEWELDVVESADAITLVSAEERRLLLDRCGRRARNIEVVRNGVDTEFFDPEIEFENPYTLGKPVTIFTGAMDYFANVQGVKWFAEYVWPRVKNKVPAAEFWIVGSNPAKEVKALRAVDGVVVTGYVSDIRPYLKHASIAVAPLQLARGVQNKVLEALAMDLPVIATPQALQGLDGTLPGSITSIADATKFAEMTSRALGVETSLHDVQGRAYVQENYDWDQNLSKLDDILAAALEAKTDLDCRESPRK